MSHHDLIDRIGRERRDQGVGVGGWMCSNSAGAGRRTSALDGRNLL
jgi:hypothetical protein